LGGENWGPLVTTADGKQARALAAAGAQLQIVHPPATVEIELRYRTTAKATLAISRATDGQWLTTAPAAPTGAVIQLSVEGLTEGDGDSVFDRAPAIRLTPSVADGVWIEAAALYYAP
jgi:hypothetical protein